MLCHIAVTILCDDFLARAIVDDVIFHLWEIRNSLEISSSIRVYLVNAVRNRCLNYIRDSRKTAASMSLDQEMAECMSDKSHPLGSLLEKEMENVIMKAVDSLPEETRKVFSKSRFEYKKYSEIAQDLSISINTVKYHIKRALAILTDELEKYLG